MSDAVLGMLIAVNHAHSTAARFATQPVGEVQRRKACILNDLGGKAETKFSIENNAQANKSKPLYEIASFSKVQDYDIYIRQAANQKNISVDLIRAIMYIETTHGYYDYAASIFGKNNSILPMNINVYFWGDAFGTRSELGLPERNVSAGGEMLRRIIKCLPDNASVEHIATIYNNLGATKVSDYGARVGEIHRLKLWSVGTK
jgi:hypothetical protein